MGEARDILLLRDNETKCMFVCVSLRLQPNAQIDFNKLLPLFFTFYNLHFVTSELESLLIVNHKCLQHYWQSSSIDGSY